MKILLSHKTQVNDFTKVYLYLEQFNFISTKIEKQTNKQKTPKQPKQQQQKPPQNKTQNKQQKLNKKPTLKKKDKQTVLSKFIT